MQVWTKRCYDGAACRSSLDETRRAFIPDNRTICDYCLLARFGLVNERYDGCGDPLSMYPLYDRADVVRALRQATGL